MESVQAPITVMQRVEWKYILSAEQTEFFCERLVGHMKPDAYGLTTIQSLYYDTPDRRIVRTSIEKPAFKEKIRLRAYGRATNASPVFLELKRKAFGIVYKRRVQATVPEVNRFFAGELNLDEEGQIDREITYFRDYYKNLEPACMILYDRTAYYEPDGDLRLTVDRNPRYRLDALSFDYAPVGIPLLDPGETILEIKVQDTIPLWLVRILSDGNIKHGSISKYGEAYRLGMRSRN
ncbi:MAG: polyphosphate polymerase domain-containing protein [Clostridia bacterium]|nr:polyphosphate polymerase domain-containing protein [Clostridia bacterium]